MEFTKQIKQKRLLREIKGELKGAIKNLRELLRENSGDLKIFLPLQLGTDQPVCVKRRKAKKKTIRKIWRIKYSSKRGENCSYFP